MERVLRIPSIGRRLQAAVAVKAQLLFEAMTRSSRSSLVDTLEQVATTDVFSKVLPGASGPSFRNEEP